MRNTFLLSKKAKGRRAPTLWLLPLGMAAAMAHAQDAPETPAVPAAEVTASAPPAVGADVQTVSAAVEGAPAAPPIAAAPVPALDAARAPMASAEPSQVAEPVEQPAPMASTEPTAMPTPVPVPVPVPAQPVAEAAPAVAAPAPVAPPAVAAAPAPAEETAPVAAAPAPVYVAPPIIPLAPDQAAERQLGARCPVDLAGRLAPQGDLMIGACQGTLPPHLAALLVALPEQDIHLPRGWREREVRQKAWFKAVPGMGQRPDFIARLGDIWIRSFEGADASTTTYLVSAPFDCADGALPSENSPEPVRVAAGSCGQAYVRQRVYQLGSDGVPVDVTAKVMPAAPAIAEADRARHRSREGKVSLDHSKLQYAAAMRWFVQYPESSQKTGPHSFSDWNREHLAFVVWNGQGFELRETVTRRQWPCDPVAPGDRPCGGFPDSGPDAYVRADTVAASAVSSP